MRIPLITQIQLSDNGGAALAMMLGCYGRFVSIQEMRKVCVSSRNGSSPAQVCAAAEHYGLIAEIKKLPAEELSGEKLPVMVCWKKKYYCIVEKIASKSVTVLDPAKGRYSLSMEKFENVYNGQAIMLCPGSDFKPGGKQVSTAKMLMNRLQGYGKWLAILSFFSAATIFLNIKYLDYKQSMVDNVMSESSEDGFFKLSVLLIATMTMQFLLNIGSGILTAKVSYRMAARSGVRFLRKLFALPLSYFEKVSHGETMERLDSNIRIDNSMLTTLVPKVFNLVAVIFYIGLIFSYNILLAAILLAVYLIISLVIISLQKYSVMINRSIISTNESMRSILLNALNAIDSIKASGSEDRFFGLWNEQINDLKNENGRSLIIDSALSMLQTLQNLLTSAIMLILGAILIINGHMTVGMYACIQTLFSNISGKLQGLFSTTRQVRVMRTNLERIDDINNYDTAPERLLTADDNPDRLPGAVECEHLYYKYNEGDDLVLNDISLSIKPGEMVALVGASGCGKSTLMKLVAGMYPVQTGSITYSGRRRDEIPDVVFHSSIGCVDQEVNMFADSVRANLKMWDDTVEDYEMILAARDAQIHKRILKNSYGYDSLISDNGRNYSGGERQRLELARMLSAEPNLLILDEFTSALDALTEKKVFDAIRAKKASCLIAAHRFSTIVECDKIIVMERGRIVEQGTHSQLYDAKGLYYRLLCLQ